MASSWLRSVFVLSANGWRRSSVQTSWTAGSLERRTMLSADAGTVVMVAASEAMIAAELPPSASMKASDGPGEIIDSVHGSQLVFVDARVSELQQLAHELPANAEMIVLDAARDGLEQIAQTLASRRHVEAIHLVGHGSAGSIELGASRVNTEALTRGAAVLHGWRQALTPDADILIYGCETGATAAGERFVAKFAELTGADIGASTNRTGASRYQADWVLEQTLGTINTPIVFSAATQAAFDAYLSDTLVVFAAGHRGDELLEVQIDGVTIDRFQLNRWGDPDFDAFDAYSMPIPEGTTADQIRIAFVNDLYDPANGIDRNVRIDRVEITGVQFTANGEVMSRTENYQMEATNVFSTGTWKPADGVTPGFRQSEWLHANGYFQLSTQPSADASTIVVRAAGLQGTEDMPLLIDGAVVHEWNNVSSTPQDYVYRASIAGLTPDRIGVALEPNGDVVQRLDERLHVDSMTLDGTIYQTESPEVFVVTRNTAPDPAPTSGYLQTELINYYGHFEFARPTTNTGSLITIVGQGTGMTEGRPHDLGDDAMELQIDGVTVRRWDYVSSGYVREYQYRAAGTVTPDRVRVVFTNDYYIPGIVDRNLIIDRIEIDGARYETESPHVFSTGTWLAADGVVPGFRQSELLHTFGYFQF